MPRPYPYWRHLRKIAYSESLALRAYARTSRPHPRCTTTRFEW